MGFTVGDIVEWTSQSGGITKTKRGEVVEVIPAKALSHGSDRHTHRRDHESYVIKVQEGKRKRRYWPRVSHLKPAPLPPLTPRVL